MTCRDCGHDFDAHSDRAVTPCMSDDDPPHRCYCDGFSVRREHRIAAE